MEAKKRALLIAEKAHQNQTYGGVYPYMFHIHQVVEIAENLECEDDIIVACALHDTLEDTELSYNNIKNEFGENVAEIVYAVTNELGRNRKERHAKTYFKIRANWKATVVKLCDRIANMEHSKKYNDGMLKMYLKEDDDFCSELAFPHDAHDVISRAWERLDKLSLTKVGQ